MKKYIHLSCTLGCVGAGAYPSSPGWSRGYTSAESSVYHRANTKTQTTNCFMDNLELPISLMCAFMEAEYLDRTHTDQWKPCELLIRTELATTLLWGNGTNHCTTMLRPHSWAATEAQISLNSIVALTLSDLGGSRGSRGQEPLEPIFFPPTDIIRMLCYYQNFKYPH